MTVSPAAISYRPAQASDTAAIKAIIRAVNINPLGIKWQRFIVAVDADGRLIGCGQIKQHRDGSRELASIAVQTAWRRQGIAAAIIQQLLRREETAVWLTCLNKLIPFYAQFGFVEATSEDDQATPPYFRLARHFFKLFQWFSHVPGYLAIMYWPGDR